MSETWSWPLLFLSLFNTPFKGFICSPDLKDQVFFCLNPNSKHILRRHKRRHIWTTANEIIKTRFAGFVGPSTPVTGITAALLCTGERDKWGDIFVAQLNPLTLIRQIKYAIIGNRSLLVHYVIFSLCHFYKNNTKTIKDFWAIDKGNNKSGPYFFFFFNQPLTQFKFHRS